MPQKKVSKFLQKLFYILDNHQYEDSISWNCNGDHILIKDHQKLQDDIIPQHFSLKKFSSFVRQLHLYNFHKKKSKNDNLIFYNQFYQRDERNLALRIVRKRKTKSKIGDSNRKPLNSTIETKYLIDSEQIKTEKPNTKSVQKINSIECLQIQQPQSIFLESKAQQDPFDIFNFS